MLENVFIIFHIIFNKKNSQFAFSSAKKRKDWFDRLVATGTNFRFGYAITVILRSTKLPQHPSVFSFMHFVRGHVSFNWTGVRDFNVRRGAKVIDEWSYGSFCKHSSQLKISTVVLRACTVHSLPACQGSMPPFGSARDVSKFESSKSAGFTRLKTVLPDVSVATENPSKKNFLTRTPLPK